MGHGSFLSTLGGRALTLAVLLGICLGVGVFTFVYAQGLAYFGTDPRTCTNCHIMNDEYSAWQKGPHHAAAVCADCHVPHTFVPKMIAEARNGYFHSKGFTLQDFHEPIRITQRNAEILQANCLRCHGDFVHALVAGSTTDKDAVRCVHCHRGAGHGL